MPMILSAPIAHAAMHPSQTQTTTSKGKWRTRLRMGGLARGLVWLALAPLAATATVVNIDFNGDRNVPGPNARPVTYQGASPAGGGAYWNSLPADSRLPGGSDDDNLTVGGTNLLDASGMRTALSFVVSPMGGDSTALRTGQDTGNPLLSAALFSDYIFNNSAGNSAGESPFEIRGFGTATTVDLYFYRTSGGVTISGRSPATFSGSGIFTTGNTIYFKSVPVSNGVVRGTFGSGTAVINGMTIVCDCAVIPVPINILVQPTNATALEGTSAAFQVQVANLDPVTYQWQRNTVEIPGATNSVYTISRVSRTNDGEQFRCLLNNTLGAVLSSNATLSVVPDTTPPSVCLVQNLGRTSLRVGFSEPVDPATATNAAHYRLTQGVSVLGATLGSDSQTVLLLTSELTYGRDYTLAVSNVLDRAWIPNSVPADTAVAFTATEFLSEIVGGAGMTGSWNSTGNDFSLSASGGDIGGTADECLFSYRMWDGNFDFQVQVESFAGSDLWAKAGLMARENLGTNSRFAAVLATPALAGACFASRSANGETAAASGSYPANYPFTWLRLERVGNVFNGYAAAEAGHWTKLGSTTMPLPSTIYFGMAGASHSSSQTATILFHDLTNAVPMAGPPSAPAREPLGPSSRRTGLVISEIMYHPAPRADGKDLEFLELFNARSFFQDLSGFRLSGDIDYVFPSGTILPAGAFLVVAKNPDDMQSAGAASSALGPYAKRLPSGSGTVRLRDRQDAVLLEVSYGSRNPWPRAADGAGHSLVLTKPSFGESDPRAWCASDLVGGSPGAPDAIGPNPLKTVCINEALVSAPASPDGFVELYNHGNQDVELSGSFLTDDPVIPKFMVPTPTVLSAQGFLAFDKGRLGFDVASAGGTIYLLSADRTRVIDAVDTKGWPTGRAVGRDPDGAPAFAELTAPSPGSANRPPLAHDLAISELMYHPVSDNSDDEYIEMHNRASHAVEVSHWRLEGAVEFAFPTNLAIPAGGYLVIARNLTNLLAKYSTLDAGNTLGNYTGSLSDAGEELRLLRPDLEAMPPATPTEVTNLPYLLVDKVDYRGGGRWGKWADGGGSSLELLDVRGDHDRAGNWGDSDESRKATNWTTIEYTGRLDFGNTSYAADSLHVLLLGEGECLIDNVEVQAVGGNNLVANSTFETGTNGWIAQGNHFSSCHETNAGYLSRCSLHLRASGDGDPGANRIRTRLTSTLTAATTATLRARVCWLRGHPEVLLRLHGNWLEATGRMAVPANLGTPGGPNSRTLTNAGPAIYDVTHVPVLPAAAEPVIVTARVRDPDGIASVQLRWRQDPSASFATLQMLDDGVGSDVAANDGIYTATIPGQASNMLVAFHVVAADQAVPSSAAMFPSDAPARECLIRFGETQPAGSFGTYRVWMTQAVLNQWSTRDQLSNDPLDVTFVYGDQRVIYNAGALYTGSPYKARSFDSPIGAWCDYVLRFPPDDRFLGATECKLCYPGNLNDDTTVQREQTAYWLADRLGIAHNERRYINLFVNGVRRGGIIEDTQVPNSDVLSEHYPDDTDGDFFKGSLWFEFTDANLANFVPTSATLQKFTTSGGIKKLARYRWNWQKRPVGGSVNDYTSLFALVDALNSGTTVYTGQVEALVDVDQWMRTFAVEHIVGNWDSIGYRNGSNMYAYKRRFGPWQLLIWDIDVSLRSDYGTGPTSDLFEAADPTIDRMFKHPPFRRIYWQALLDAANGPLLNSNVDPLLDAKYAALRANGVTAQSPAAIKTWITARRDYVLSQLATVATNFAVNGPAAFTTNVDLVTLAGSAPVAVRSIAVNGALYPLTWTAVTTWSMPLPLQPGTNRVTVLGYDRLGQWVAGASNQLIIVSTAVPSQPTNAVRINEWLASNTSTLADADGSYDDWFELYNPGTNTVDLSGWFLTDDLSRPTQWRIPSGTSLAPRGFLLVWADGQTNQNGADADLHASFKLDRGGEAIGLADSVGRMVDSVVFAYQTNDVSQGRFPDGGEPPLVFMTTPTPRAPNQWAGQTSVTLGPAGTATLVWPAAPGKTYRVEYKEALDSPTWAILTNSITATTSSLIIHDSTAARSQRFYRIVLAD